MDNLEADTGLMQYLRNRVDVLKGRNEKLQDLKDFVLLKQPEIFNEFKKEGR